MKRTIEANAVNAVMEAYIDGTKTRNTLKLKAIFHKQAVMSGYMDDDLLMGSPNVFFEALEMHEIAPNYMARVVHVDVTGDAARARVVEDNLMGKSFVNDFHLLNGEEGWQIVSKLFHHDD